MAPKKNTNKRTIALGKILNLSDFPESIISVLRLQGLLGFVSIDELVYDDLVYEFYDNLSMETKIDDDNEGKETNFLKSRVKNKTIILGIEEICECFGIIDNLDGFDTYDWYGWGIKGNTLTMCVDSLHNSVEHSGIVRPKREFLNVNQQILLKILKECLLPTGSNYSIVGMLECSIVYHLETNSLIQFPVMVMQPMWIHKSHRQLPYDMALTKVFRKAKIKLEKHHKRNYDYKKMDATSLRRPKSPSSSSSSSEEKSSAKKKSKWPIIEEVVEEDLETINEENLQEGESLAEHRHSFIDGTTIASSVDDAEWYQFDALIQGWILSTITDEVSDLVLANNLSAHALWTAIYNLFHDNKHARAMQLEHHCFCTTVKEQLSINEYCRLLKNLSEYLDDVDAPVTEHALVLQVLQAHKRAKGKQLNSSVPFFFPSFFYELERHPKSRGDQINNATFNVSPHKSPKRSNRKKL
ncbi:unnamed protein product [Cuscuta campestris]|uniref:Uncharacterized protein n=1 Tax=Cuscuta campestris TaxID=132261 RepID=A0A484L9F4_9ASTE|nr:unnamed protein product [Cuscuta campestris]